MTPDLTLVIKAAAALRDAHAAADEAHSLLCKTQYRTDVLTRFLADTADALCDIADTYEKRVEDLSSRTIGSSAAEETAANEEVAA